MKLGRVFTKHHLTIAIILAIFFSLVYFIISLMQHMRYESYGYDLGIFDQMVWKYSRFLGFYDSVKERVLLQDHMNVTLLLLAPLYWLWSDVRMLLFFQAAWLGASSFGVYLIARHRKLSHGIALGITFCYGLFYGMQEAVYYNFHASIIGVGLVPWIAYFLETKRRTFMWIAVMLLILTQENMGLALISLGCFYIFQKKYRQTIIIWFIIGLLYTLVVPWIIAHLSVRGNEFAPTLPSTVTGYVTQFFDDANKRQVWVWSLASFAFIPLLSISALMAITVDLFQYFLSGPAFVRNWTTYTHHRAMLDIFLTLGVLDVVSRQKRPIVRNVMVALVCVATVWSQIAWKLPVANLIDATYWHRAQWMRDTDKLLSLIPPQGVVAAENHIVPHISQRNDIYVIWPVQFPATDPRCVLADSPTGQSCWWFGIPNNTDYIVLDVREHQDETAMLETNDHWQQSIHTMEKAGIIAIEKSIGTARLYKMKHLPFP